MSVSKLEVHEFNSSLSSNATMKMNRNAIVGMNEFKGLLEHGLNLQALKHFFFSVVQPSHQNEKFNSGGARFFQDERDSLKDS